MNREDLEKMDINQLFEIANELTGGELQKAAEQQTGEIDLTQISAADFIAGVQDGSIELSDLEKDAEETKEESPMDVGYVMGVGMSAGLLDGLKEQNAQVEKQAETEEKSVKDALMELIQGEMEKQAGGALRATIGKAFDWSSGKAKWVGGKIQGGQYPDSTRFNRYTAAVGTAGAGSGTLAGYLLGNRKVKNVNK